jgi:hypothetical protein
VLHDLELLVSVASHDAAEGQVDLLHGGEWWTHATRQVQHLQRWTCQQGCSCRYGHIHHYLLLLLLLLLLLCHYIAGSQVEVSRLLNVIRVEVQAGGGPPSGAACH